MVTGAGRPEKVDGYSGEALSMRIIVAVTVGLLVMVPGLHAQGDRYVGYWGNLGLGGGVRIASSNGSTETTGGGAGLVRMGGKINDYVLLGAEVSGWGWEEDGVFVVRGNWTATGVFFPSADLGLLLKVGVGGATARAVETQTVGTGRSITKLGFGATAGVAYDIPFGPTISLTPGIDFLYQFIDDPDVRKAGLLLFTIGVTWH
jgi:hypothetical protein